MRFISKLALGFACIAVSASTCHATSLEALRPAVAHLKPLDEAAQKDSFKQACPANAAIMAEVEYSTRNVGLSVANDATVAAVDLKGSILIAAPQNPADNESIKRKVKELGTQDIWLVVTGGPKAIASFYLVPKQQGAPCPLIAAHFDVTLVDG